MKEGPPGREDSLAADMYTKRLIETRRQGWVALTARRSLADAVIDALFAGT